MGTPVCWVLLAWLPPLPSCWTSQVQCVHCGFVVHVHPVRRLLCLFTFSSLQWEWPRLTGGLLSGLNGHTLDTPGSLTPCEVTLLTHSHSRT